MQTSSNPLYNIFPQYTRTDLDQIYSEYSYDVDVSSEQILNGALDWNKNNPTKLKKKPQKRWISKPKREIKERPNNEEVVLRQKAEKLPSKMEKKDSAIETSPESKQPSLSYILQHGRNKVEMVEADLNTIDLSKFVVLVPREIYEKQEKEMFDRQFSSILPTIPMNKPESTPKQTNTVSAQTLTPSGSSLFDNSVPVQDKLRILGINDENKQQDVKDFVLNMNLGMNETVTSPTTPPNTPISPFKPKAKKPFKKRYYSDQ